MVWSTNLCVRELSTWTNQSERNIENDNQERRQTKKKATKRKNEDKRNDPSRNPKAFSIQSAKKAARMVQRTADIQAKKQHVPSVDRTPLEPPPILVVVVGPPKLEKSTLVRGLTS